MADQDQTIFRERAIEQYRQRLDQHIMLRLVYPPVRLFLWALLLLIFGVFLFVYSVPVPINVSGTAMIIGYKIGQNQAKPQIIMLLILPSEAQANVHHGQAVRFCLGQAGSCMNTSVATEETTVMSPESIRDRYQLPLSLALLVTQPSTVAIAYPEPLSLGPVYAGSHGSIEIQTGSESALSFLFSINHFITI